MSLFVSPCILICLLICPYLSKYMRGKHLALLRTRNFLLLHGSFARSRPRAVSRTGITITPRLHDWRFHPPSRNSVPPVSLSTGRLRGGEKEVSPPARRIDGRGSETCCSVRAHWSATVEQGGGGSWRDLQGRRLVMFGVDTFAPLAQDDQMLQQSASAPFQLPSAVIL